MKIRLLLLIAFVLFCAAPALAEDLYIANAATAAQMTTAIAKARKEVDTLGVPKK
jgi:hypothetical protein